MQKDTNLVELEKCCQTHIFLQNFVLIEPRTSPTKFAKFGNFVNFHNFANARSEVALEGSPEEKQAAAAARASDRSLCAVAFFAPTSGWARSEKCIQYDKDALAKFKRSEDKCELFSTTCRY